MHLVLKLLGCTLQVHVGSFLHVKARQLMRVRLIVFKIIVLRWAPVYEACLTSAIKIQVSLGRWKFKKKGDYIRKKFRIVNINLLTRRHQLATVLQALS